MMVKLASAAPFVVLAGQVLFIAPRVAYGGAATAEATSCAKLFPYEPEQFLAKLLAVSDETDLYAVPATFQHAFEMKLPHAIIKDAKTFAYDALPCEWYARVHVMSVDERKPGSATRAYLSIGELPQPLLFGESNECLSSDLATKSVEANGWHGGLLPGEVVAWGYRKGHALINFIPVGKVTPSGSDCVSNITVIFY